MITRISLLRSSNRRITLSTIVMSLGCLLVLLVMPRQALAYHTGMPASNVIGQTDFTSQLNSIPHYQSGMGAYPAQIATDGTRFAVADQGANRVLLYNSIPTGVNQLPDVVVGQSDFMGIAANQGSPNPTATGLNGPMGVAFANGKLIISDSNNNRVLIYNSIPTSNGTPADLVIGQSTMTTKTSATAAAGLFRPTFISFDASSGKLLLADSTNNRVLVYNSVPSANGASANVVVGQTTFTSGSWGTAANRLFSPHSARIFAGKLLVADTNNSRVLIWNIVPTTNGASADIVLGQTSFTTGAWHSSSANSTVYASDIGFDGTHLVVANSGRILIFNSIPTTNNAAANSVLGQSSFSAYVTSNLTAKQISNPSGVVFVGGVLYGSDTTRVLGFPSLTTFSAATTVIGQSSFTQYLPFAGIATAQTLNNPNGVATDGKHLFVADSSDNRILIWNSIPSSMNIPADVVIGQPDFSSYGANQGGGAAANTLNAPYGIYTDGTRLFVADSGNNRVLIFNHIPTANNASADIVVGQADMATSTYNGITATSYNWVVGVSYDPGSGKMVVSDSGAARVLVYNSVPTSNGAAANVVIGEPDMTSSYVCPTFGPTCLGNDGTARILNGKLVVPDTYDDRVLIWNTIPTTNNAPADIVLGQPNFTTTNYAGGASGPSASTLAYNYDVAYDGTHFYVNDGDTGRILVWNGIPTTNAAPASVAIGASNMTSYGSFTPSQNSFSYPASNGSSVAIAGHTLIVLDNRGNRALLFDNPIPTATASTPSVTDTLKPIVSWSFADGDPGDTQSAFQVQFDTSNQFNSPNLIDSGSVSGTSSSLASPSNLADGQWYARVRLTDSQGDMGDWGQVLGMMIDTVAPDKATPLYPTAGQTVPGKFTFGWESFDTGSGIDHYALYVDGQLWNENLTNPSFALTNAMADGQHSYVVTTFDKAGNSSTSDTVNFIVDSKAPPQVTVISFGTVQMHGAKTVYYTGHRPTIIGLAEPGAAISIAFQPGGMVLATTTDSNGRWSVTPTSDIVNGDYTATITAADAAGNRSAPMVLGVHINTGLAATGTPLWPVSLLGMSMLIVSRRLLRRRAASGL